MLVKFDQIVTGSILIHTCNITFLTLNVIQNGKKENIF